MPTVAAHSGASANGSGAPTLPSAKPIGTHIRGIESLSEPGPENPRLRLVAGGVVPGTRYRIVRWLGEGGMGVVYEAEHIDIERKVALKILRFDLSRQPKMVQVFRDEARAASRLGSDHIVEIYDFGELADGRLFFAMELLPGKNMALSPGDVPVDQGVLIGILRQVCKGLQVAHEAGVVHRDVKPENLIRCPSTRGADSVKIVDFGISAMLAAGDASDAAIAGTPHYMAPEQIGGSTFDARLDIYALGCTAYELLIGTPPFEATTIPELLRMQLEDIPVPPHVRRPDLVVAPSLETVILRCLAKRPQDRYADMADLEAALCEAQIAAGISTAWDDLPLPDLQDHERREYLLKSMPSVAPFPQPGRRKWLWPAVAGLGVVGTASLAALLLGQTSGSKPQDRRGDEVYELVDRARNAAAKANWVVPPAGDPAADTAFSGVVALEALEGPLAKPADQRAEELRHEFASTLVRQADELSDQGAQLAASTHYLWALAFEPTNAHAFARAQIDTSLLSGFIRRAEQGQFSQTEFATAMASVAEAEHDPATRRRRFQDFAQMMETADLPPAAAVLLAEEVRESLPNTAARPAAESPRDAQADHDAATSDQDPPETAAASTGAESIGDTDGAVEPQLRPDPTPRTENKAKPNASSRLNRANRDPVAAKDLAAQAVISLHSGRRSEAEALFNRALAADQTNPSALIGLSDIYFDTGDDQKAVAYAEKAVTAASRASAYRVKLGDAYFKVLRYRDALVQYEQGKALGDKKADARIEKVKAKLGI